MTTSFEERIRALETEAERAEPGTAAHILNRAGDLCLSAGAKERALRYYGRAIDANLYGRRFDAAAGLCRKLLRVSPGAVRTRCTLAWLTLGHDDLTETLRELGEYVSAAIAAGRAGRAVRQLERMAEVTRDARVRELISAHLERLGATATAERVRARVRTDGAPPPERDDEQREALYTEIANAALEAPDAR